MQFISYNILQYLWSLVKEHYCTVWYKYYYYFRKHLRHCRYPVIFIITDGPHSPVTKLFPKQLITSLDIHTISFNPVAHTSLMKLALTVIKAECVGGEGGRGRFVAPDKSVVEALVAGSNGDVRSLLNSLQFASLKGDCVVCFTV